MNEAVYRWSISLLLNPRIDEFQKFDSRGLLMFRISA